MGWRKLRAKLAEHQNGSTTDMEYLVISQVYHLFFFEASIFSRRVLHEQRLDLTEEKNQELLFTSVRHDIKQLKSKTAKHYHPLIDETFEEAKELLLRDD